MKAFGMLHHVKDHLYTRLAKSRQVDLDGVKVLLDPATVPRAVAKAVLRGDYELPERRAVKSMVRPDDTVLEMGGGIGVVSITAAQIAGPMRVHVFEPQLNACALIKQNAERNGVEISCINAAIGSASGGRSFYQSTNIISSSFIDRGARSKHKVVQVEVDVVEIGELVSRLRPNILISDIEGAEIDVLGSFDFSGIDVVIIEMHPHIVGAAATEALSKTIQQNGLPEITTLRNSNTHVFSRQREPAFEQFQNQYQ